MNNMNHNFFLHKNMFFVHFFEKTSVGSLKNFYITSFRFITKLFHAQSFSYLIIF